MAESREWLRTGRKSRGPGRDWKEDRKAIGKTTFVVNNGREHVVRPCSDGIPARSGT